MLNFKDNNISGTIPASIGRLKNLKYFEANNNSITGTIPACVAELENIVCFSVEKNKLSVGTFQQTFLSGMV